MVLMIGVLCSVTASVYLVQGSISTLKGQIGSTDVALLYAMEHGVLQGYASFGKCWFHVTIWMQLIYSIPCMALPDSISLEP